MISKENVTASGTYSSMYLSVFGQVTHPADMTNHAFEYLIANLCYICITSYHLPTSSGTSQENNLDSLVFFLLGCCVTIGKPNDREYQQIRFMLAWSKANERWSNFSSMAMEVLVLWVWLSFDRDLNYH
jgi:hypothetical protein